MNTPPPLPLPPGDPRQAARAKWMLWLSVLVFLTVNAAILFKACTDAPVRSITAAGSAMEKVAAAFKRGTITTSFVSYATTLTNELKLQVATVKQTEIFTRKEETTTGFGLIPLPDVIVEARVPVEYTYYVDLKGSWKINVEGHRIQVVAPALQFNTPAMDVSGMTLEVRKGAFKVGDVQENLRKSLASLAARQADQSLALVRETARRQVAEFIEQWIVRSYTDGGDYAVTVRFADEPAPVNPGEPLLPRR